MMSQNGTVDMAALTTQFRKTYFEECAELLDASESHLNDLVEGRASTDTLHAVFRAVHSIKGGGGAFGFTQLVSFAHVLETLLDGLRDGRVPLGTETINTLVRANDMLSHVVAAARDGHELSGGDIETITATLDELARPAAERQLGAPPNAEKTESQSGSETGAQHYRIRFTPGSDLLRKANEPLLLIRELKRFGELSVVTDCTSLPDLAVMIPEDAYLSWTLDLKTTAAISALQEVFEFVVDDCDLAIDVVSDAGVPNIDIAVSRGEAEPLANPSSGNSTTEPNTRGAAPPSIRVDTDKIDRLVNLIGELVITQAMLAQQGSTLPIEQYPALIQSLETLSQHARELQESVMAIRAQPVKSVFVRMPRLVRDLAQTLGKEARLVMTGEATEIDKTVIEQLGDPLTHMIRNAIDHGIESPEVRVAAGKPRQGTIHLSAEHRSGRIVLEISDDGRGIDRDRVLRKAQDKGLVQPGTSLSDDEIDNLVFLPGFSTAAAVSNISGRGVGMDVVKRNIQALGGRVSIASTPGAGSRFILSLPLTLAVLDGMVVAVGAESYVLPLTRIIESLRPRAKDIHTVVGSSDVLAIRGEYAPLVYLHRIFDVSNAITDPSKGIVVMVETESGGKVGVVVDELIGQQQVVIKSLETNYEPVEGVAGATILGSGRVALILDIAGLQQLSGKSRVRLLSAPMHADVVLQ